jgi:hypothetical protein
VPTVGSAEHGGSGSGVGGDVDLAVQSGSSCGAPLGWPIAAGCGYSSFDAFAFLELFERNY